MAQQTDLKTLTARSLKWNIVDRVATQALYAVTGIVLARLLSHDDFGLVGAVLVFQAFASLLVDSGFSSALIQRRNPSRLDYSSVLWFNLAMAVVLYAILWFCAPLIADWFQGDQRLIPLSRVMFISFIINALAIVQTNRLMKIMDVKRIAAANSLGLTAGALIGIWLAIEGYGAWAIVWQTIAVAVVKSATLWIIGHWTPLLRFSWRSLRSFMAVGSGVMFTSLLNTIFQNIYAFFIGNRAGLASLGFYTQADKWSKMGIMSVNQTLTSSFLPLLSAVQDDAERYARVAAKTSRLTAYLSLPAMGFLAAMAEPIFHALFGTKWDASIPLFQLLLLRGAFFLPTTLYSNYILSLGKAKLIVSVEIIRDAIALIALALTLPILTLTTPDNPVLGVEILLWGQVLAAAIAWAVTLYLAAPLTHRHLTDYLKDLAPYASLTAAIMGAMWALSLIITNPWLLLTAQAALALTTYLAVNHIAGSTIQRDVFAYILGRFRKKS